MRVEPSAKRIYQTPCAVNGDVGFAVAVVIGRNRQIVGQSPSRTRRILRSISGDTKCRRTGENRIIGSTVGIKIADDRFVSGQTEPKIPDSEIITAQIRPVAVAENRHIFVSVAVIIGEKQVYDRM